jgi:hypothetical protein
MRLPLAAVLAALWLAPLYAQTSEATGIQGVESNPASPLMKIKGIVETENPLGGIFKIWSLRSFVGKFDGVTTHQLYVTLGYSSPGGRKHFNAASDGALTPLKVTPLASEFDGGCTRKMFAFGCNYTEDFGVEVATAALRDHAASGYPIKISSKRGDVIVIVISPRQIAAQLETMQKCLEFIRAHSPGPGGQPGPQLLSRSGLGFKASKITDEIAAKTGLHKGPGIVVFEVAPGSIAERSGLKVLDRIMAVAGCGPSMDSQAAMKKCIAAKKAYLGMVVDRGGGLTTVGIKLYAEGR